MGSDQKRISQRTLIPNLWCAMALNPLPVTCADPASILPSVVRVWDLSRPNVYYDGIGRFMYDSTTKQDSHKCNRSRICGGGYLDASSEASLTRCSCFMSTRYDLHILEDSWCQTSASIEGVAKYTYPLIMQACATFQACQIKGWQVPYSLCR